MRKKILTILLLIICVMCFGFFLASCSLINHHICAYNIIDELDSTCTDEGYFRKACSCGAFNYETIIHKKGHDYNEDNICLRCNHKINESYGLEYLLNEDGQSYSVIGIGSCEDLDICIPLYNQGLPVTGIGDRAFAGNEDITSIIISKNVEKIGKEAFLDCEKLFFFTLSNSINYIGSSAFPSGGMSKSAQTNKYFLGSLEDWFNIELANGTSISFGNLYFEHVLFTECVIPSNVTKLENEYLVRCNSLKDVTIGTNVIEMEVSCFSGCYNLENVSFNNSLKILPSHLFADCFSLRSVVLPNNLEIIDSYAFVGCGINEILLPNTLKKIEHDAFEGTNLTAIKLPDGLEEIGVDAFTYTNIQELYLPKNLNAFLLLSRSTNLKNVFVDDSNPYFKDINGVVYSKDGKSLKYYPSGREETNFTIPANINKIESGAFYNCDYLRDIILTENIEYIDSLNFLGFNTELYDLNFNEYDNGYYLGTKNNPYFLLVQTHINAKSINVHQNCKFINDRAFANAQLEEVTIPNSVTNIVGNAFSACNYLKKVIINDLVNWCNIDFDTNPLSYAKNLYINSNKITELKIPASVTEIKHGTFKGGSFINVIIHDNATSIGNSAFDDCSNLTSVTIGNSVTTIGNYVFNDCSNLTSVIIGNSVTSIGRFAFYDCDSLTKVYYSGTQSEWAEIFIEGYNSSLTSATRYYYSETEPTTVGNYWHYVDGIPTIWTTKE